KKLPGRGQVLPALPLPFKIEPKPGPLLGKGKQPSKSNRPAIGGTAVTGAKSTQPKEMKAANPAEQQLESYNRTMRRRMEHLGTGPAEGGNALQEQRQKRIARKKKR